MKKFIEGLLKYIFIFIGAIAAFYIFVLMFFDILLGESYITEGLVYVSALIIGLLGIVIYLLHKIRKDINNKDNND